MSESNRRKVVVGTSAAEATSLAAELFKATVCEATDSRGTCHVALSGGTTPHALYKQLAETCGYGELPWEHLHIYFGDERDVPHDDVESNYHMVQKTLLDHVPVAPTHIHPMPADAEDLSVAAERYEQMIRQRVPAGDDGLPAFDLVLLGMGADGHTASLFAGTETLDETSSLVTACFVPVLGRNRMTFTFPLINSARIVMLIVTGSDKAEAVSKVLSPDEHHDNLLPAGRISPKGSFIIVLDRSAARLFTARATTK